MSEGAIRALVRLEESMGVTLFERSHTAMTAAVRNGRAISAVN